jgi:hypothetical protein
MHIVLQYVIEEPNIYLYFTLLLIIQAFHKWLNKQNLFIKMQYTLAWFIFALMRLLKLKMTSLWQMFMIKLNIFAWDGYTRKAKPKSTSLNNFVYFWVILNRNALQNCTITEQKQNEVLTICRCKIIAFYRWKVKICNQHKQSMSGDCQIHFQSFFEVLQLI